MIQIDWVDLLLKNGDPIEKKGVKAYSLGKTFPRYAEFWANFAVPNRDREDSSKLKRDLEPEIADIIYNHYGVFHQLTFAYSQISNLSSPLLDVATPFYHLATTVDLIERTFVLAFSYHDSKFTRLSQNEFEKRASEFWKDYDKNFDRFAKNLRPVNIQIHSITQLFPLCVPKSDVRTRFIDSARQIREYRNLLAHALPPLKLKRNGEECIPTIDYFDIYRDKSWSTLRDMINPAHYANAHDVITGLADSLVVSANDLWEFLLNQMKNVLPMDDISRISALFSELDPEFASGVSGNVEYNPANAWEESKVSPPQIPRPPTHPSGVNTNVEEDPL